MNTTWSGICARRLDRHGLSAPVKDAGPADIARAMCGTHAQIMSAAELSIGIRMASGTRADVRAALWVQRTLVKTYGPRGTVHLLPAEDLPLWTGALSAVPSAPNALAKDIRMTSEQTEAVIAAIDTALADTEMTVDELTGAVVESAGAWAGDLVMPAFQGFWPRWCQAIATAARRGVLCFGPNRGRRTTYTHPRRWLPGFEPMDGQTALAEIVRRYQDSYGPATPAHFAQWLGVPRGWAAAACRRGSGRTRYRTAP